uniref:Uncharacterized protein n=1 Tax=Panagrolaimus davidi TaxID=227884 RepID=A0A914PLV0_9BILA
MPGSNVPPQPDPASFVANKVAEETQSNDIVQLAPRNNVFQRYDGSITGDAGNDNEVKKEEGNENTREKSIFSLPEDVGIIVERIVAKKEPVGNSQVFIKEIEIANEYDPYPAILSFKRPSEGTLMSACRKVGIVYDAAAYLFWANNIKVKLVKAHSDSIQPEPWSNGFDCLSLFLTGSHQNGAQMQLNVNQKLYDSVMKANYNDEQLIRMFVKFNDEHFTLIVHWLSCKIGVYENGILKKYGDWTSTTSNELIVLIAKNGETYAPVYGL